MSGYQKIVVSPPGPTARDFEAVRFISRYIRKTGFRNRLV